MKYLIISAFLTLFTTNCAENDSNVVKPKLTESNPKEINKTEGVKGKIDDEIIDSIKIGIQTKYKINIKQISFNADSTFVSFDFFKKTDTGRWLLIQTYFSQKDPISLLDPIFADYDGDGYADLSFRSSTAARSANEVRSLFIFNKDHLDTVKNATDYPNLRFNQDLHCIDSWMVHGGCTTVFLKLISDSLKEFASVNIFDTLLTVTETNKKGIAKIILERATNKNENYVRYKNYKPLSVFSEDKETN